ncbi:20S proteasome component alpha 2 [Schizosaccharomyces japonicus yFS275]|uniref:Proteasome subunit alpha type n=1 Tax=Schizosaccharomyces japonicus (strain yFS275 / FY16936) TaxID=402676 RepID=B6K2N5_SCHJY|nr:20S proteasome component alpha 2 [Schizosaccharomyces japonicus yFS275]EEB07416.1 20S proteasome component alpha 2 [Schizosaccharomyces japonicus yFS275]
MADRYAFSLTTFSPNGKLVQIEYALNAVNAGVTSIGIKARNGVVLATEKKTNTELALGSSLQKISGITPDVGMVYSGMGPDYRVLVDKARKVSHTNYKRIYNEYPPTKILVQEVASIMQESTQSGGVRPFGVSLLIAGIDDNGPSLYQVDPSGTYFAWKATAIGKSSTVAKTFLEKRFNEEMELEDAIHTAILALKETFEGELTEDTVEIAVVSETQGESGIVGRPGGRFHQLSTTEIRDYLDQL